MTGADSTDHTKGPEEVMCHSARDGDCDWEHCPQNRDGEPERSGRHCRLDRWCDDCGEAPFNCRCPKRQEALGGLATPDLLSDLQGAADHYEHKGAVDCRVEDLVDPGGLNKYRERAQRLRTLHSILGRLR